MKVIRYLWIFICLFCYASVLIPPTAFSFGVLLGYCIPGVVGINIIIFFISRRLWSIVVPLFGIPFIVCTIQFSDPSPVSEDSFSVLSFNAKLFRRPGSYREFSMDMIEWTATDSAEIKVIPEHSTDSRWEPLDVNKRISNEGYTSFSVSAPIPDNEHNLGSAIFSKFDTTKTGIVFTDSSSISMAIFEDVLIGHHAVRIYSVHLASMRLDEISAQGFFDKVSQTAEKLIEGAIRRSSQLDQLIAHIEACPYPFIVSGDFNETPYSYNYWRMRRHATDAFVDEGHGLGFTFHSMRPVARIDYQFFSDGIVVENLEVDTNMRLSDHMPVRGRYRVE